MSNITDVCKAARIGDLEALKKLHSDGGIDFNETASWFEPHSAWNPYYWLESSPSVVLGPMTPLMIAVTYGHFECVEYLLETVKVDVNVRGGRLTDTTALECVYLYTPKYGVPGNADAIESILRHHRADFNHDSHFPQGVAAVIARGNCTKYFTAKLTNGAIQESKKVIYNDFILTPLSYLWNMPILASFIGAFCAFNYGWVYTEKALFILGVGLTSKAIEFKSNSKLKAYGFTIGSTAVLYSVIGALVNKDEQSSNSTFDYGSFASQTFNTGVKNSFWAAIGCVSADAIHCSTTKYLSR